MEMMLNRIAPEVYRLGLYATYSLFCFLFFHCRMLLTSTHWKVSVLLPCTCTLYFQLTVIFIVIIGPDDMVKMHCIFLWYCVTAWLVLVMGLCCVQPAHVKTCLVGAEVTVPITDGKLNLGTWQGRSSSKLFL